MSSSESACRPTSSRSGARRTAGRPGASMVPMSQPLPFTHSTSTGWPVMSATFVFTEVLPPPCSTSLGSPPKSLRGVDAQRQVFADALGGVLGDRRLGVAVGPQVLHHLLPFNSTMVLAMTASWSQGNRIHVSWLTSVM